MPDCSSNALSVDPSRIDAAVAVLRRGGLVVYPTETLYGLGADALASQALERLVAVKGREVGKPISVLVDGEAMLHTLVAEVSPRARRLIEEFWPGPLTLVLPAKSGVPEILTGGSGWIGARVSSHSVATELVRALGRPVTTPSANPAAQTPPRSICLAYQYFGGEVECYLDAGDLPGEPPSTVARVEGDVVRVLRQGAVAAEALDNK